MTCDPDISTLKSPVKITIVTAVLNGEKYLEETIQSVLAQDSREIEYIMIDGGSTDGTLGIIQRYDSHLSNWISEPDKGIADALNKGLKMSRGRYVLVLHANDRLLHPLILRSVQAILSKEQFDILSFPVWKEKSGVEFFLYKPTRPIWWYHFKTIIPHQGAFVHRRVFDRIGGFRTIFSIALDYDFFYRALAYGFTVRFGKQPISIMGGNGISSDPAMLKKRLSEEALVQKLNEKKLLWRMAQKVFQSCYVPYKTQIAPKLTLR